MWVEMARGDVDGYGNGSGSRDVLGMGMVGR